MIPHTRTHTLTKSDCYSWLAVPRSRHQGPWHTKALCHLLCRCSLLLPASQPASQPSDAIDLTSFSPFHSSAQWSGHKHNPNDLHQYSTAPRCCKTDSTHTHIYIQYTYTHTQCMDTSVQCEHSYTNTVNPGVTKPSACTVFSDCSEKRNWKHEIYSLLTNKRRQELGCSVTNLCTFSYCYYERLSPQWRELIINVCMSVGVPSPKPVWTGTIKRLCKETFGCEALKIQRKVRHWPQRNGRRRNLDDAHWTEESYSNYRKTNKNSE